MSSVLLASRFVFEVGNLTCRAQNCTCVMSVWILAQRAALTLQILSGFWCCKDWWELARLRDCKPEVQVLCY